MPFHVSSREHNALILMLELARSEDFVSLDSIARRMRISQGYLEEIARGLKSAGLITGRQGRSGGYRLALAPSKISLEQILVAIEGPIELIECQGKNNLCPMAHRCPSKGVWGIVQKAIKKSLAETTLDKIK